MLALKASATGGLANSRRKAELVFDPVKFGIEDETGAWKTCEMVIPGTLPWRHPARKPRRLQRTKSGIENK